jgi:hypothetical protein
MARDHVGIVNIDSFGARLGRDEPALKNLILLTALRYLRSGEKII